MSFVHRDMDDEFQELLVQIVEVREWHGEEVSWLQHGRLELVSALHQLDKVKNLS